MKIALITGQDGSYLAQLLLEMGYMGPPEQVQTHCSAMDSSSF